MTAVHPPRPRRARAASTVAFALVAPLLLTLVFGVMEGARVFSAWLVVTAEAREAARYAAVRFDSAASADEREAFIADVEAFATARVTAMLAPAGLLPPEVEVDDGYVAVTLRYDVGLVVPLVDRALPNPFPVAGRSWMRGE